jgi:hypothetical protein
MYQRRYGIALTGPDGKPLNPGNAWVSGPCFEPKVGLQALREMLDLYVTAGKLSFLCPLNCSASRV